MRRLVVSSLVLVACGDPGEAARPAADGPAAPAPASTDEGAGVAPAALARSAPPIDVVSTRGAIEHWPRIVPGVEAHAISSYDRSGGNDDGFAGTYSELYEDGREHVIFDAVGPGVLRTLWFTSKVDGNGPLPFDSVRFTFDDEATPRITVDASALFGGTAAPFVKPLVAGNQESSGGFASWTPLAFRRRLKITTNARPGFYQAHYETFPADWDVQSSDGTSVAKDLAALFGADGTGFTTLPLDAIPLDHSLAGAGTIDALRFEPEGGTATREALAAARIRIFFDGATEAQVDVPLGAFFGSGLGETKVRAVPWTMDVGRYESRLPMPYWEGARIVVSGLAGKLSIHNGLALEPRAEHATLHAIESEAKPTVAGADFVYADVAGAGKIVGTVLTVEPRTAGEKRWWEGDQRTFVDGASTASIHGTGHEDDHLGGWSNEFLERPFSLPMQGCPKTIVLDDPPEGQTNAEATMYRLWPGIPFLHGARHSTEHGAGNGVESRYASVTFVYRQARDRLERTFESDFATTIVAAIRADNAGVKLRFGFDGASVQRLRVIVDGVLVGAWHVPSGAAPGGAQQGDYFVPARLTRGKSSLTLRLEPEAPTAPAHVEVWSVLP